MSARWRLPMWARYVGALALVGSAQVGPALASEDAGLRDLVAVGIVAEGRAIVLATPGLPEEGRVWRFRSLDTSEIPQPIRDVVLASTGTKLFVQPARVGGVVLDLTRQQRHNTPLQYVSAGDLAAGGDAPRHTHRLPGQRFVSFEYGDGRVVDDTGAVQPEYPAFTAVGGAVSDDGALLYVRADGTVVLCGEPPSRRGDCRELAARPGAPVLAVRGRSMRRPDGAAAAPRFVVLSDRGEEAELLDPEASGGTGPGVHRPEAALRACLLLHGMSMADREIASHVNALIRESAETWAADGQPITDWRFFLTAPDHELYAPVLEFASSETVFPADFEILERLSVRSGAVSHRQPAVDRLYDRYLRLDVETRERQCAIYYRTHSLPGSWLIEYWLYYPFDVGGFVSHPHDPEHIFVEVDKLGGAPYRIIGAGHGYAAGNNVYTADRPGAHGLDLPLFAMVELGKHASAPDVDRDGVFTPGVDENEYRERAKIWGVRDVIGTLNNQVLAYDSAMSIPRRPGHCLAPLTSEARFPGALHPAARARCRVQPMPPGRPPAGRRLFRLSDWMIVPPCHELTGECARRHVTEHPDFTDVRTILKEWAFPESFLRATYNLGPRHRMHSIGLGYAMDFDRVPGVGRFLPLPGRIGIEGFSWRQDITDPDRESCIDKCHHRWGWGWGIRYEQFLSNLFGIFSAVRAYSPPLRDTWIAFGPFVEAPLGRRSNVNLQGALAFRPYESPRFELRISAGLWKPKTNHVGLHAGPDHRR